MNSGTLLLMQSMTNNSDMISVGPVDMQYMCPCGFVIIVGNIVITNAIPYNMDIERIYSYQLNNLTSSLRANSDIGTIIN